MSVYDAIVQEAKAIFEKSASECGGKEYINLIDIIRDVAMPNCVIMDDDTIYDICADVDPEYFNY